MRASVQRGGQTRLRFAFAAAWTLSLAVFAVLAGKAEAAETLAYYSDYFSFVGEDAQGKVAFALDNNRGQDGEQFQAEHFVVLHDEHKGWVAVRGSGFYPNPAGVLRTIPDSADFAFSGAPDKGISIKSGSNGIVLDITPIKPIVVRNKGQASYWLGSAAATLQWSGRTIAGRVIYEYLYRPGWNRLTRKYPGQWRDFHALYLRVEGGGDLYLHRENPADEEPLHGTTLGFLVLAGRASELQAIAIDVLQRSQALGFYRWPQAWRASFVAGGVAYRLDLALVQRKSISNWIIGGFSMGVAKGELRHESKSQSIYGLAELIL